MFSYRRRSTATLPSLHTLSDAEADVRTAVRRFAETEVKPHVSDMDEKQYLDGNVLRGLFAQGYMGLMLPAEYGGSGASFMSAILVIEELARVDAAVSLVCDLQTLVCTLLATHGSDFLKQRYLPRMATDTVASFCLSEPSSGSDAFALKTRAVRDGDAFVLNGNKLWISSANEADVFFVFANVDPSAGYRGITCFVVEKAWGVQVGKRERKMGLRASSTCPVTFDNVRVPMSHVLGEVGKGYKYAISGLNEGRIGIAAQMLGIAQGAFDNTMPYLFQRKQFGQFIGDMQGMQLQYGQLAVDLEAARLLVYNAARLKEQGAHVAKEAAMAKLFASQVAERVASKCIELAGGVGYTKDFPIEKFYRDAKIGSIYEGTSNIQLITIAKLLKEQYTV